MEKGKCKNRMNVNWVEYCGWLGWLWQEVGQKHVAVGEDVS
jgi:hypothetical protein